MVISPKVIMVSGGVLNIMLCLAHFQWVIHAADQDPLQDFCVADLDSMQVTLNGFPCKPSNDVNSTSFASTLLRLPMGENMALGSAVNLANAMTFPALNTQGLSIARTDFRPRGLVPPHAHPRASEILFVTRGTLLVGFVSTSRQLFMQVLREGDLFVFPRALPHFQFNVDEHLPALSISSFNSQNPGVYELAASLLSTQPLLPIQVLQIALGIHDQQELDRLISNAP
ncbi:hypothetical protein KP509_29G074400 [Ceratopteris richardii]|uniref:Germin-like protein n=1 Tax=Ceratopteris richardii TaxID=49495 RepID=A0A8T2R9H3_CERRI|nr:hypothetical protein KP509_29G074400 [Ceratopteris richardii]